MGLGQMLQSQVFGRNSKGRDPLLGDETRRPHDLDQGSMASENGAGCPTGKSFLVFGNRVKPKITTNQKYFAFPEGQISAITLAIPSHSEGRRPSSRTRGGLRWTQELRLTSAA